MFPPPSAAPWPSPSTPPGASAGGVPQAMPAPGLDGLKGLLQVTVDGRVQLMDRKGYEALLRGDPAAGVQLLTDDPAGAVGGGGSSSAQPALAKPPKPSFTVREEGGKTVIEGTAQADRLTIDQLRDGRLVVTDDRGRSATLDAKQSRNLVVKGGADDDVIHATKRVTQALTIEGGAGRDDILGGAGNDRLIGGSEADVIRGGAGDDEIDGGAGDDDLRGGRGRDTVRGGEGHDYIEGGADDDHLYGDAGRDWIYGLGGNDTIEGGAEPDYLDGGEDDDTLHGDRGDDALFGGNGNDGLHGGEGRDLLAGGRGRNAYDGGAGADDLYHAKGEKPALDMAGGDRAVEVDQRKAVGHRALPVGKAVGEPSGHEGDFAARVHGDIDALGSIPEGRRLLDELDRSKAKFPVNETRAGPRTLVDEIEYDRSFRSLAAYGATTVEDWEWVGPTVSLFHELSHALASATGKVESGRTDGQCNEELAATGLPIHPDGDASKPLAPASRTFTENGLRRTLHMPERPHYGDGEAPECRGDPRPR